ncbi:hypothetical protein VTN00DRAFT_6524 [Thermoascus crustaceus]|uniref:uncharacterized protein n=1 Tax=Thermoascus crustaceus TaxID=5088 RepID=UPI0037431D1F
MAILSTLLLLGYLLPTNNAFTTATTPKINRQHVITRFNPTRHASSSTTPMQVGNGDFAFGADITGLQTFLPFGTLSSWGWHNSSLPTKPGQTVPEDFTGMDWWTHERLVNYDQPNPAEGEISQWLIANPQRVNLGRVGFVFFEDSRQGEMRDVSEEESTGEVQELDLYSGTLTSEFSVNGTTVKVQTWVDPESDTLAIKVHSELLIQGQLGFFFDYPYATGESKFEAPFVGVWDAVEKHRTELDVSELGQEAKITHQLDNTTYYTLIRWEGGDCQIPTNVDSVNRASASWWKSYWETGAFIDLTATGNTTALELQRRIILSQYLLAVNEAGRDPPQESGLVNNGWYGKFHMEMYLWHSAHWISWGKNHLLGRSIDVYDRFLESSIERARDQGYEGARWGKMSDPTGRSAPGEINSLLIWQQPHVFYFAEMEYKSVVVTTSDNHQKRQEVLRKWDRILTESANFMTSFAFWNESTQVYDLGPPMYPASENTPPNSTTNPTFELAYWRFGLDVASAWKKRLNQPVPESWTHVAEHLAPLPTTSSPATDNKATYTLYSGIPNMWTNPETVSDHPALISIYGLLPPSHAVNISTVSTTLTHVSQSWNFTSCWGWDFPMLAMTAARLGDVESAVGYLVNNENFAFDDVGMPVGPVGKEAPTPYFPGSGGLLLAVGMLAGGWGGREGVDGWDGEGNNAPGFPVEWDLRVRTVGSRSPAGPAGHDVSPSRGSVDDIQRFTILIHDPGLLELGIVCRINIPDFRPLSGSGPVPPDEKPPGL